MTDDRYPAEADHVRVGAGKSMFSASTPAFAWSNTGLMVVAFASSDRYIYYSTLQSPDGELSGQTQALYNGNPMGIQDGPAMAVFNGKFYLVHRGTRWGAYTGQEIWCTTFDGKDWSEDTVITDANGGHPNTFNTPALAVFNGKLYLAHRGTKWGNYTGNEIWFTSSSDGVNWAVDTPIPNTTTEDSPTLAVLNNTLYVAHRGASGEYSHIWYTTTSDGQNWSSDQQVKDSGGGIPGITGAPALTAAESNLYLLHRGTAWSTYTGNELWFTSFDGNKWAEDAVLRTNGLVGDTYQILPSPAAATDYRGLVWWSAGDLDSRIEIHLV